MGGSGLRHRNTTQPRRRPELTWYADPSVPIQEIPKALHVRVAIQDSHSYGYVLKTLRGSVYDFAKRLCFQNATRNRIRFANTGMYFPIQKI